MLKECVLMLIDDQIDDVHTLSYYFRRYGVEKIEYATNAVKGLELLRGMSAKPFMILVDYFLIPDGGHSFIKEAMKVAPFQNIRYELMTGRDLDDLQNVIALHKGAADLDLEVRKFIKGYLI